MDSVPDPAERAALLRIAADVARACGRLVADERPEHLAVAHTKASPVDVVTVMDQRSEELARRLLGQRRPGDAIVGEEGEDAHGSTGITWLVDPIDGTVNYLYDCPEYAVSVAAVLGDPWSERGFTPVAGAVYQPAADELYLAALGGGSRVVTAAGTRELRADPAATLDQSLVGTGFAYEADARARQARILTRVLPAARDIRRHGAASLDLCAVARGRQDAYYEFGLKPWDYAAGWIVATEAGLEVRRPGAGLLMVGASAVLDELQDLVLGAPSAGG